MALWGLPCLEGSSVVSAGGVYSSCGAWAPHRSAWAPHRGAWAPHCGAWALHRGAFSCDGAAALGCVDLVAGGSPALEHRLSSCGSWA